MKTKLTFLFIMILAVFMTSNIGYSQNLNEGFDGSFPPADWTNINISGHAWVQSSVSNTGSGAASYEGTDYYSYTGELITPRLDLTQSSSDQLTFYIKNAEWYGDQNICKVYISTDGGTTYSLLATYDTDIPAYTQKTINLELPGIPQTDDVYIKFWGEDNYGHDILIDDVVGPALYVPACPAPTNQVVTNISHTGAQLNWVSGGSTNFNVEYGPAGFTQGTGTMLTIATDTFVVLSNLSEASFYDWYVRDSCSATDTSTWVGPNSFVTDPATTTIPSLFDFPTNSDTHFQFMHESMSSVFIDSNANNGSSGYGLHFEGGSYTGWSGTPSSTNVSAAFNNTTHIAKAKMKVDATGNAYLFMDFDLKMFYTYGKGYSWLRVMINDTIYAKTLTGDSVWNPMTKSADNWRNISLNLSDYAGTIFSVTFETAMKYASDNSSWDKAYIDNIHFYVPPANEVQITDILRNYGGFNATANDTVTVLVTNNGMSNQTSLPISYTLDNGTVVTENMPYLAAFSTDTFEFATTFDATASGNHILAVYTALTGDVDNSNDTMYKAFTTAPLNDVGITDITGVYGGLGVTTHDTVRVEITNFGRTNQINLPLSYVLDNGTIVLETIDTVFANTTVNYTFATTYDASASGKHMLTVYTDLSGDENNANDTMYKHFITYGVHSIPFTEDFEDGYTYFENNNANNSNYVLDTSIVHSGTYAVHDAYVADANDVLHETGMMDLTSSTTPVFDFWHIAFTENCCDDALIEISTDNGANWVIIDDSLYLGEGNYNSRFAGGSYSDWNSGLSAANNSQWKMERFNLAAFKDDSVRIRFRLDADYSVQKAGWYIDDITVQEEPNAIANLGNDTTICLGSTLELVSGSAVGYTYLWTVNGDTIANTTNSITTDSAGIYTVEVMGIATVAYDTIVVTVGALPTIVSFTGSADICAGDSTVLKGEFTGVSPWTFSLWSNGYLDTITVTNPIDSGYVSPLDTTMYFITQVTDGNGCVSVGYSDTVIINVNPLPVVSFTGLASTYCVDGLADTLVGMPANGVFSGNGIQGTVFNPSIAGVGNHVVTYAYTDSNSCSNSAVNNTTVVEVLTTTQDAAICEGDSTSISVLASVNPTTSGGVFFSEYIEGSSNNKALEIYNGTAATINLDEYSIMTNYNGNPWSGQYHFPAGATLAAGDVFVIANNGADAAILAVADDTLAYNQGGYVVGFNGDDVRALFHKTSATDSMMIDIIGAYDGVDPGKGWDVAGVTEATKDHSLIRKASVIAGDTSWTAIAGTDSLTSQYMVYPKNDFSHLGSHTVSASTLTYLWSTGETTPSISVSPATTTTYTVIVDNGNCQATDSVVVTVNPYPVVNLGNDTTIKWTNGSVTLDAGNPNATWLWNTGATTQTETFDNTNLTNGSANTVYVTVTENGCSASDTLVITVMDDVSINGALDNMELKVYPNPTKGHFNMAINGFEGDLDMTIVNLAGQTVYSEKINVTPSYVNKFDVSTLSTGVYYIKLTTENGVKVLKLVIR